LLSSWTVPSRIGHIFWTSLQEHARPIEPFHAITHAHHANFVAPGSLAFRGDKGDILLLLIAGEDAHIVCYDKGIDA
jgi:hypothetical protein